jgi:pimeloyl-ACP methyl ester carboxylesterase
MPPVVSLPDASSGSDADDALAGESFATANGIDICYQSLGDPGAPVILLIMGLGMQLVAWPDAFCLRLVEQGFRVIRFDNRDTGRSTRIVWRQRPRLLLAIARGLLRLPVTAPYLLADMADDAAGLLTALQVPRAHLVGVSLGGMVAQCLAARHPQQVLSLSSIMSATGNWRVALGKPAALRQLLSRPAKPDCLRSQADHLLRVFSVIGSPGFPCGCGGAAPAGRARPAPRALSAWTGAPIAGRHRRRRPAARTGDHPRADPRRARSRRSAAAAVGRP